MSKRLDVIFAVKALVVAALPASDVMGLDNDAAAPSRISPLGRVIVRAGDPGDPEIDLSPIRYHYRHRIPVEVAAYATAGRTPEQALDDMLGAIGAMVALDRTLGGLVDWLDVMEPETDDIFADGAAPARGAEPMLVAEYSTSIPLN